MAAKLLHSLADDNPDLQKQIGCMTGIFQLFDRHQVLTARRISQKRLPSGIHHSMNMFNFTDSVVFYVSNFSSLSISEMILHFSR